MSWVLVEINGGVVETSSDSAVSMRVIDWDNIKADFDYAVEVLENLETSELPKATIQRIQDSIKELWSPKLQEYKALMESGEFQEKTYQAWHDSNRSQFPNGVSLFAQDDSLDDLKVRLNQIPVEIRRTQGMAAIKDQYLPIVILSEGKIVEHISISFDIGNPKFTIFQDDGEWVLNLDGQWETLDATSEQEAIIEALPKVPFGDLWLIPNGNQNPNSWIAVDATSTTN